MQTSTSDSDGPEVILRGIISRRIVEPVNIEFLRNAEDCNANHAGSRLRSAQSSTARVNVQNSQPIHSRVSRRIFIVCLILGSGEFGL